MSKNEDAMSALRRLAGRDNFEGGGTPNGNKGNNLYNNLNELNKMKKDGRLRPDGEFQLYPKNPKFYVSPGEYQKGNLGSSQYALANGGSAGRDNFAGGGAPAAAPSSSPAAAPPINSLFDTNGIDNDRAYLSNMYQGILGRAPDEGGLDYWQDQLESGKMNEQQIFKSFAESPEFQGLYKSNPNDAISDLYQYSFNRAPDQGGLDYWLNQAKGGMGLGDMVNSFNSSQEGQNMRGINDAYFSYGNDLATKDQMSKALADVSGGKSVSDVGKNIKNDLFVNDMYKLHLGREPDKPSYDYYMDMLRGDNNPFAVRDQIAGSQEARNRHHHIASDASNLAPARSPTFQQASSDTVNNLLGGLKDYEIPNVGRDIWNTGAADNLDKMKLARWSSMPFTSKDNDLLWGSVGTAAHNYDFSNSIAFTRALQKIGVPLQAALAIAANGGFESGTSKGYMPWSQKEVKGFGGQGTLQFTGSRGDNYRKIAEQNGGVDSLTGNVATIADELKGNKRYREIINAAAKAPDLATAVAIINRYYEIGGHQEDSQARRAEFGAQLQSQYNNYAKDNPFQAYSYEPPLLTTTETQDSMGGVDQEGVTAGLNNGTGVPAFMPVTGAVPDYGDPSTPYYNYTPPDQVIMPDHFNPIVSNHTPPTVNHNGNHNGNHNQNHHIIVGPTIDVATGQQYGGNWDSSGIHSKTNHTSGSDPYFGHQMEGYTYHHMPFGMSHYTNNSHVRNMSTGFYEDPYTAYMNDQLRAGNNKGGRIKEEDPSDVAKRISKAQPPNFPDGGNSHKMLRSFGGRTGYALDGSVEDDEHNKPSLPMMAQNNEAMQRAQTFAHDNEADKLRQTAKEPSAWDYFKGPLQFAVQSYVSPDIAPQRVTKELVDAPQTVTHFGKGLAESAYRGATLPGDVVQGKVDPASEEGFKRVQDLAGLAQTGSFAFTRPAGALASGASREAEQAIPAMTKSQSQDAMRRLWELGQGDTGGFKNWNHQWNVQEAPKFKQQAAPAPQVEAAAAQNVTPQQASNYQRITNPLGFYSQGHEAAMTMLPEGPRSWQEMLAILSNPQKGNVRKEELKWAGLEADAFDPAHKITREEIAEKFKQQFPQTDVVWQREANPEELAQAIAHRDELADASNRARAAYIRAHINEWRDPLLMHDLEQETLTPDSEALLRPYGMPNGEASHYLSRLYQAHENPDAYAEIIQSMPEHVRQRAENAANAQWDLTAAMRRVYDIENTSSAGTPKWKSYTHHGGENYSISALTVPYNDAKRLSENIHPDIEEKYAPQLNEATNAIKSLDDDYYSAIRRIADEQERYERANRPRVAEMIANVVKQSNVPETEAIKIAQMRANELDWGGMALKLGDLDKVKYIQQTEAEFKNLREAKSRASYERQNILDKMRIENALSVPDYTKQLYQHHQHLGDVKNPLLHQRWKDRVGPNGEKIFSNEELQSDVGQQGREEGFKDPALHAQLEEVRKQLKAAKEVEQSELAKEMNDFNLYKNKLTQEFEEKKYKEKEKYLPPPISDDEQKQLSLLLEKKKDRQKLSPLEEKQLNYLAWKAERPLDQERVIRDEYELRAHQIKEDTHQKTLDLSHQPNLVPGSDEHFNALDKILQEEDRLLAPEREWRDGALEKNRENYDNAQQALSDFNVERDKLLDVAYDKYMGRASEIKAKHDPTIRELNNKIDTMPKSGIIPLFPHVGTTDQWTELGVKHALAHAIENGYDQIFIMGGNEHARRYSAGLRQAITEVNWESPSDEIAKYYKPYTELPADRTIVEHKNAQGQKLFAVNDAEGMMESPWSLSKEGAVKSFFERANHLARGKALAEYYANKLYGKKVEELTGRQFDRVSDRTREHVDDTHRLVTATSAENPDTKHTFQVDQNGKIVASSFHQAVGKKLNEVIGGISKDVMKENSGHIPLENYMMDSEGYTQHYERKVPSTYKSIIKKYLGVDSKIEPGNLLEKGKSYEVPDIGNAVPGTGFLDYDENNRFRVAYPDGTYRGGLTESQAQRILDTERQAAEQGNRIRIVTKPIVEGHLGIGNNQFYVLGGDLPGRMFDNYQKAVEYYQGVQAAKKSAPSSIKGPHGTAIHITPEMRDAYNRMKKEKGSVFPAYKRGGWIDDKDNQNAMETVKNLSRRAG